MRKIVCPTCGSVVIAVPSGTTVEIRGTLDLTRCVRLQAFAQSGEDIDDPLECEDMEAAVEAALGERPGDVVGAAEAVQEAEDEALILWRDESYARRQFKRWETERPAEVGLAGQRYRCTVRDISPGGACVAMDDVEVLQPDAYVVLSLEGFGSLPAEIRRIEAADELARLYFLVDLAKQVALAHWLMSLPSAPVLDA